MVYLVINGKKKINGDFGDKSRVWTLERNWDFED